MAATSESRSHSSGYSLSVYSSTTEETASSIQPSISSERSSPCSTRLRWS
jgi:hypothetical protein